MHPLWKKEKEHLADSASYMHTFEHDCIVLYKEYMSSNIHTASLLYGMHSPGGHSC